MERKKGFGHIKGSIQNSKQLISKSNNFLKSIFSQLHGIKINIMSMINPN